MRLERKWARVVIVLGGAELVPILLLALAGLLGVRGSIWLAVAVLTPSVICTAAALVVAFRKLRCPCCGKELAPLCWNPGNRFYCKYCGTPFLFDDDPPDSSTTTETREEP